MNDVSVTVPVYPLVAVFVLVKHFNDEYVANRLGTEVEL